MPDDPKAKDVLERYSRMKSVRSTYEPQWQDIRDLVRPGAADFTRATSPGQSRSDSIYDGTAKQANEELAGGLNSYLTNPADRWFDLEVEDMDELANEPEAQAWLQSVADIIYSEYAHPAVRFQPAIREAYLDVSAFGTCSLNQEYSRRTGRIYFRTHALSACYFDQNSEGTIDSELRCMKWDKRQLIQAFGEDALTKKVRDDNTKDRKYEVIHAVYPRQDRDYRKMDAVNMVFASCWVMVEECHLLKESGYASFPYHVGRWATVAEEIYGYSPAHACLPDIRMLNRMEYTIIKAAQKATDPPIWTYNDGVMLPIQTGPGSINFIEPNLGEQPFWTMEHKGNFPISLETSDRKREMIKKAFHLDWVEITRKKERQTAYELQQDEEENIRQLAPILGGLQSDILHPAIARSYELLRDAGRIPDAPEVIDRQPLKVVYISPAARAQKAMKAISLGRWVQDIVPLAQVAPDVVDAIDTDTVAQDLASYRSVSRRVVRSPEAIAAIRQQRAQQQQAMAMAEIAKPASEAVLNIAKARETGLAA